MASGGLDDPRSPNSRIVSTARYPEGAPREAANWQRLTDGGSEGPCGWCKDRFGLSWQLTPDGMDEVFSDPDPARAQRAMQAMLGMGKLDIAALRDAADGVAAR